MGLRGLAAGLMSGLLLLGSTPYPFAAEDVIPLSAENRRALASLGEGVVGQAVPAQPISDPATLFHLQAGEWKYQITAGTDEGKTQLEVLSQTPPTDRGATWKRAVGKEYIQHFKVTGNGGIFVTAEAVESHELLVHFTPDVMLFTAGMNPGESRSFESKIGVSKIQNPTSEEYKGSLKATTSYEGAYKVTTPAGTFNAVLIKTDYRIHVDLVRVKDTHYVFYADGVGKVAAIDGMQVSALLFYHTHNRTPKVLVSHTSRSAKVTAIR
jgi:hypothetical protein